MVLLIKVTIVHYMTAYVILVLNNEVYFTVVSWYWLVMVELAKQHLLSGT